MIKRGEVYWVKLDPAIGGEMKKTRPQPRSSIRRR